MGKVKITVFMLIRMAVSTWFAPVEGRRVGTAVAVSTVGAVVPAVDGTVEHDDRHQQDEVHNRQHHTELLHL